MPPNGPRDLHFLVALREKNAWVGAVFFIFGVLFFGYLFIDLIF
ncbi:MAG: hypothetical protein ACPGRZ_10785 [Alphaproteobacteria bacterium]